MSKLSIPPLRHGCGSWVVTHKATGDVVGEFYDFDTVAKFNPETCLVETAMDYLGRINAAILAEARAAKLGTYECSRCRKQQPLGEIHACKS